jgi:hypothetical protein
MSWQTGGALATSMARNIRIKYTTAMNYAYANLYWGDMQILHQKSRVFTEIQTGLTLKQIRSIKYVILSERK